MSSIRILLVFVLTALFLSVMAGVSVLTVAEADDPVVETDESRQVPTIPLVGLENQNMGVPAWNVAGAGSEPIKQGHGIFWTNPVCIEIAYYYLASRDYSNIDANGVAGLVGVPNISDFPNFSAALANGGHQVSDITVQWTPQTLGDDVQGQDWMYDAGTVTETRYYTGGEYTILLNGNAMVGGPMPRTTMLIDYNTLNNPPNSCFDDEISGFTDAARPVDKSANSPVSVQDAAAAFIQDLGSNGVKFVFDSFQPAGQFEFAGSGRGGGYFEVQTGKLQAAVIALADLQLTKSVSEPAPQRGETVTYTLKIVNNGSATATDMALHDMLPNGLSFTSAAPISAGCVHAQGNVNCSLGDLVSGASTTVFVNVQIDANATGSLVNGASVTSTTFDNDMSNNSADVTITVNVPSAVPGITPIGLVGMAGVLAVLVGWRLRRARGRWSRQGM